MKLPERTKSYRKALCSQYLESATGVLHLGAHLGHEASEYSRFDKPVLWIEAIPEIHGHLAEHLRKFPGQRSLCALLSNIDGERRSFFISNNSKGVSSSLFRFGAFGEGARSLWPQHGLRMVDSIDLQTVTLDTLFGSHGISARDYDYWVVDLQGAEKLALSGATRSLRDCRALYTEISSVEVYEGGVLWPELRGWLDSAGFIPLWQPELPHDDVLFVSKAELERVRGEFQSRHYLEHNQKRLEHLASLQLDLSGKSVLEVGAGIGDHTGFYLERGCTVTVTDVRPENLAILNDRFRGRKDVEVRPLDLTRPEELGRRFDVVHCYGILYHLDNPAAALEFLAAHCSDLMLVETCVSFGDGLELNPLEEPASRRSQAFHGTGCRPTRRWIWSHLEALVPHVYVPHTQPAHAEFPLEWDSEGDPGRLHRAVFVASRKTLDMLPTLSSRLLEKQTKQS